MPEKPVLIAAVAAAVIVLVVIGFVIGQSVDLAGASRTPTAMPAATPRPTATRVPTATPVIVTREAVIRQVRQLSRIETTSYVIERVIEIKQSDNFWPDWLVGDRMLLVANGTVVAGVDLTKLRPEDVIVNDAAKTITLTLPASEVFSAGLNNEKTRIFDRQRGLFAPTNTDLESRARQEAEKEILNAALEDGILGRAGADAQRSMEQFLSMFGYRVTVKIAPATSAG